MLFHPCHRIDFKYFREMRLRLLFLLFLVAQTALAQRYSFFQRGVEDGLPNAAINDIEEDETGMIWLATDGGGLVRFDGTSFQSFDVFENLPSPFITVLTKDAKGNFWIGTERGIAFYDGKSLTVFEDGPKSRINSISIAEDAVWVATREGLFSFKNGKFVADAGTAKKDVLSAVKWAGSLFYCTAEGSFEREITMGTKRLFGGVTKIIPVKNGVVHCSADTVFVQLGNLHFKYPIAEVRDAVLAENGIFWFASQRNGLVKVGEQKIETIDANHGLTYFRVRSLLFKDGKIWIGSQQGLSFFQNPNSFVIDASQGLADEKVHVALKFADEYWLGTASGVSRIAKNGEIVNYNSTSGLPSGVVLDLALHNKILWAATEQGVAYFSNNRFIPLKDANDFTFCLKSLGNKLLFGSASGAYSFSGNQLMAIPFADSLPDGIVAIESGQNADVFLGLSGAVYTRESAGLTRIKKWHGVDIDTLQIFAVKSTRNLSCLLVNGVGVYVWNGVEVLLVNQKNGLSSVNFKSAEFFGDRLWVTTDQGMQFIQLTSNETRPFLTGSIINYASINQRDFNNRGLSISPSGTLLNCSNNGLFVVDDASIKTDISLGVSITDVKLFFKAETPWSQFTNELTPWSNLPVNLDLPYDQNYLSFKFDVAPFLAYDAKVYIRFKLQGQDKNWTYADDRREAFFTNIRPSNYVFLVESSLSPDFLNVERASFSFKIVPPFWRTWWFITIAIVSVLGLTVFVMQFRIKQLNQKLALENALADSERKALRLQMNPHFVFNALDAISGFIFNNEPKEAVRYLGSFAKLMRITLESSRETVVPVHNEIQLLKNYIDLEQLRFNNKFQYAIHVDDDVDVYESQLPPMLLQPFVENAILHGLRNKEGDDGFLEIRFEEANDHLVCTIEDNGIGREKSAELNKGRNKKSLATSITEERIELLSQSLGERVSFSISDLKNESGAATGTKVVITFPHLVADE